MPIVTVNQFLTSFPEFSTSDIGRISEYISQVEIEACYDVFDPATQELAIKLHVAHLLTMYDRANSSMSQGGLAVKRLKTKHDQIDFAVGDSDAYGLSTSQYGMRLQALIDRNSVGFSMTFC